MSYVSVAPNSFVNWSAHGPIVPGMLDRGVGDYKNVGDWTWEFDPGAYWWLRPADSTPQPAPTLGMGDCGCGGKCGGCGDGHSHGLAGLGIFESTDIASWGVGEWATIAVGLFIVGKLVSGGRKATKAVKGYRRKQSRRAKALKAAQAI